MAIWHLYIIPVCTDWLTWINNEKDFTLRPLSLVSSHIKRNSSFRATKLKLLDYLFPTWSLLGIGFQQLSRKISNFAFVFYFYTLSTYICIIGNSEKKGKKSLPNSIIIHSFRRGRGKKCETFFSTFDCCWKFEDERMSVFTHPSFIQFVNKRMISLKEQAGGWENVGIRFSQLFILFLYTFCSSSLVDIESRVGVSRVEHMVIRSVKFARLCDACVCTMYSLIRTQAVFWSNDFNLVVFRLFLGN